MTVDKTKSSFFRRDDSKTGSQTANREGNSGNESTNYNRNSSDQNNERREWKPRNNEQSGERREWKPRNNEQSGERREWTPRNNDQSGERREWKPRNNEQSGERREWTPRNNDQSGERREWKPRTEQSGERREWTPRNNDQSGERREWKPRTEQSGERREWTPRNNDQSGERREWKPRTEQSGERREWTPRNNDQSGERREWKPRTDQSGERREWKPRTEQSGERREWTPRNNDQSGERREWKPRTEQSGERREWTPRNNDQSGERREWKPRTEQSGERREWTPRNTEQSGERREWKPRIKTNTEFIKANPNHNQNQEIEQTLASVNGPLRLNRFIAMSGVCSRREADELITSGQVTVNGTVIDQLGVKVTKEDEVCLNGERLKGERKVYIIMNKPKGFITTTDDPHADRTVIDLLKGEVKERVYPVGRLDKNTTGVLLLTNDGELTNQLTHPSFEKRKLYHVFLNKPCTQEDLDQLLAGIELEDGEIKVDEVEFVESMLDEVGVEIHSGKNRIVRRMFEHLGYDVVKLDRVFFAGFTKMGLRRGFWRHLSPREVATLRSGNYN